MSQKNTPNTPDRKNKRNYNVDPRRLHFEDESRNRRGNFEDEPRNRRGNFENEQRTIRVNFEDESRNSRPSKKNDNQQNNMSAVAIVRPTRLHQTANFCAQYPSIHSHAYVPAIQGVPPVVNPYTPSIINNYRYRDPRWNAIAPPMQAQNPMYSFPIPRGPVSGIPVPIYSPIAPPPTCPYGPMINSPMLAEPPINIFSVPPPMYQPSPMATAVAPVDFLNQSFDSAYCEPALTAPSVDNSPNNNDELTKTRPVLIPKQTKPLDPASYLTLPTELFPKARLLPLDPNPIIHEFCRTPDFDNISTWVMDLEFGMPRRPVTRPIATYDAPSNSVHCINTSGAIHPAFERSNEQFRQMAMYYYDSAVSMWYKGFIVTYSDRSVNNFQSWLQVPMQIYGMCWP